MENLELMHEKLYQYIYQNWKKSFNEPAGNLRYKFLDPAAAYRGQLWDWDSYFCGVGLIDVYENTAQYLQGCVLNFLDHQREDGSIPYMISAVKPTMAALPGLDLKMRDLGCDLNSIKPLLAQMALLTFSRLESDGWGEMVYGRLKRHVAHWETTQQVKNGLFVWRSHRGSGTDNHPALYGRPLNSSAGVELNCFMYLEYKAMAEIARICGDADSKADYLKKAEALAKSINDNMWDEIDGLYYHLDMLSAKPALATQDVCWNVPIKFKTWTCFMPMYAGIAPEKHAERMMREHLLKPDEFWSDFGLRTLAKNEPVYNTGETSNPSNWQGPIWVVSTYLLFKGMLNYGYFDEAGKTAENLLFTLCRDIDANGALHEYYNPETGKSRINKGFMNWNALAGLMVPELLGKNRAAFMPVGRASAI